MTMINQVKSDIFQMLLEIDDLKTLEVFRLQLAKSKALKKEETPLFMEAIVDIEEDESLEEIMQFQNYEPSDYQTFRAKADVIDWGASLEEMLEILEN